MIHAADNLRLYGAGYYLRMFLEEIRQLDPGQISKISCIMVSHDTEDETVQGIPVVCYQKEKLQEKDVVILTLGNRYTKTVYELLEKTGADVWELDFNMFQQGAYDEIRAQVQPFLNAWPSGGLGLNEPVVSERVYAWTLWWQGEDQAPEIVKRCWDSQREHIPQNVQHIVVTSENVRNYISLPDEIWKKTLCGQIDPTSFSDILRGILLYKYGGFWFDATLLLLQDLDPSILKCELFTRNIPETQFCSNAMWSGWFWYARKGSLLFHFFSEAYVWYFLNYVKRYYLTVDYFISIASNTFSEVEKALNEIPYNNESALELSRHLQEPYCEERWHAYIGNSFVQKLTYKLQWSSEIEKKGTMYEFIIQQLE